MPNDPLEVAEHHLTQAFTKDAAGNIEESNHDALLSIAASMRVMTDLQKEVLRGLEQIASNTKG